jgi:N-acetyltransferase
VADPWRDHPVLEGEHIILRPMERSDGPAIVDAASDGRLWELFYTAVPGPESIDAYLDSAAAEAAYGRAMPFAVIDKASGKLVGATRYMRMNCMCVQLRTDAFNFQSQRAIERLGAKRDGVLRNHSILNGRNRDTVVYSILANEWNGVKTHLRFRLARA